MNNVNGFVTTVYDASAEAEAKALEAAESLGLPYVPRNKRSIAKLFQDTAANRLLVVSSIDVKLHIPGQKPLFFHPSMAHLRVQRMLRGERDPLMEAANVCPGDRIVDCTAGMAADSIVFSHAVGESGEVIALESERLLHYVVSTGLKRYASEIPELNAAMRRIGMVQEDHLHYLSRLSARSVDIVYFDPMFRHPLTDSAALDPMRAVTNARPLEKSAIEQAKRVAVKAVVLKEQLNSGEFERLGFHHRIQKDSKFTFGVMRL